MVAYDGRTDDRQLDIAAGFHLRKRQRDERIRLNQRAVRKDDEQGKAEQKDRQPYEVFHESMPPKPAGRVLRPCRGGNRNIRRGFARRPADGHRRAGICPASRPAHSCKCRPSASRSARSPRRSLHPAARSGIPA